VIDADELRADLDSAIDHAAGLYGQICAAVRAAGRQPRSRAADLMIAATAASNAPLLYTVNAGDFRSAGRPNDL
jgi:predicted nucleic acid-binding protein